MTTSKLPSAEEWAAQYTDELEKMLRAYARAVLEAAAEVADKAKSILEYMGIAEDIRKLKDDL